MKTCSSCGFKKGDRVKMVSQLIKLDGSMVGVVHGIVDNWPEGHCHIVIWEETKCGTGLPNSNVQRDEEPS
jgi:hypothetical protein